MTIIQKNNINNILSDLGRCIELISIDPNFNNLSIGLYEKNGIYTVWSFSKVTGIKERIEYYPTINVTKARDEAKLIAAKVLEGQSASQIKRDRRTEMTAAEIFKQYMDERVYPPQYAPGTVKKWISAYRSYFVVTTPDKVIRARCLKNKNALITDIKLSDLNMDNLKRFHRFIGSESPISANTIIEMFRTVMEYAKDQNKYYE